MDTAAAPPQDSHSISSSSRPHDETQRYKHDIAQAKAMAASTSSIRHRKKSVHQQASSIKNKSDAVALGLRGLDEAESLREEGHIQSALELYKSAIEVLIGLLQNNSSIPNYDMPTLNQRVQVALSDAEQLKEKIQRGSIQQQATCEVTRETCLSRIRQYLATIRGPGGAPAIKNSPTKTQQPLSNAKLQPRKHSPPTNSKMASTRSMIGGTHNHHPQGTATRTTRRNTAPANNIRPQVAQQQHSPQPPQAKQQQQPSSALANMAAKENQLLVQTVYDEMYVPTEQLQSTTWEDIAGLADAKQALQEAAIMPMLRPDLFTGLRRPQNVMLYGPPGTGKTMLVKAVAYESKCSLFLCTASAMVSKWTGDSEKLIRALFAAAKQYSPSIIFIDEIDALLSTRKSDGEHEASRRFKTEFMTQMDGIGPAKNDSERILLIACTNCPWDIDSAILRRFPRRIFVPLPDKDARKALLKNLLKKAGKHSLKKGDISDLVKKLRGFSGSDMQAIASEASFGPLRSVGSLNEIRNIRAKDVRPISVEDFEGAIEQATKSVSKDQLKRYDEWQNENGAGS